MTAARSVDDLGGKDNLEVIFIGEVEVFSEHFERFLVGMADAHRFSLFLSDAEKLNQPSPYDPRLFILGVERKMWR